MIGEKIKEYRTKAGLTQKALGEKCGIAEPTIRKYELGILNPKIGTVKKISAALNVSVPDIMGWAYFDEQYPDLANEVKQIEDIERNFGEGSAKMLELYAKLNKRGKEKAVDAIEDLTMIESYTKND